MIMSVYHREHKIKDGMIGIPNYWGEKVGNFRPLAIRYGEKKALYLWHHKGWFKHSKPDTMREAIRIKDETGNDDFIQLKGDYPNIESS